MAKPCLKDYPLMEWAESVGIMRNGDWHKSLYKMLQARLRIVDEQQFIQSVYIDNLPEGLTRDLIGRILYYRGEGILFYVDELDKFEFLPYAKQGTGTGTSIDQ